MEISQLYFSLQHIRGLFGAEGVEFRRQSGILQSEDRHGDQRGVLRPVDGRRGHGNARDHGLRTPGFEAVDDEASLREAVRRLGLPAVLKTRTLGYDGHGQRVLKTEADIAGALPLLAVPCILDTARS